MGTNLNCFDMKLRPEEDAMTHLIKSIAKKNKSETSSNKTKNDDCLRHNISRDNAPSAVGPPARHASKDFCGNTVGATSMADLCTFYSTASGQEAPAHT